MINEIFKIKSTDDLVSWILTWYKKLFFNTNIYAFAYYMLEYKYFCRYLNSDNFSSGRPYNIRSSLVHNYLKK